MSRHRNVRSMNYEDEYYDDDDMYGHSVEDNYCISPGTAAQFTYNRDSHVELSNFMGEVERIPEEDEDDENDGSSISHRNSFEYKRPPLSDLDNAKLNSCLEEVRNVLGDTVPEHILIDTIMKHGYSLDLTLNELLNQQDAPKPQREKRENRRNRSQEFDNDLDPDPNTVIHPNISPQTPYSDISDDNIFLHILPRLGGNMKFGPDSVEELSGVDSKEKDSVRFIRDTLESPVRLSDNTKTDKNEPHIVSKNENAQRENPLSQPNTLGEQTTAQKHQDKHSSNTYSDISRSLSGLIQSDKVATSSKPLTNTNQNIPDSHKTNKITASSGMSLAELGTIHNSNGKTFKSLSELKNIDKESKGKNTDIAGFIKSGRIQGEFNQQQSSGPSSSNFPKTHGVSCIKQTEVETHQKQKAFSLQDLAREHERKVSQTSQSQEKINGLSHYKPGNTMTTGTGGIIKQSTSLAGFANTTLADLAKENTHQNQNMTSITSLSQLSNSLDSLKLNAGKGSNKEPSHEAGMISIDLPENEAVQKRKETSLSDLMKSYSQPAKEGQNVTVLPGQATLSLADLAKAHGVTKKEPSTVLNLGHTGGVEKTGSIIGKHADKDMKPQTKALVPLGLKVKDTKTTMDSLTSRIESFAGIEVRQQAAYIPVRNKPTHPQNCSSASKPEKSVELISANKSNHSLFGGIGPQQDDLASKDNCKDGSVASVKKESKLTLADLAKPAGAIEGRVSNMKTTDMKLHAKEPGNENRLGPSKYTIVTQNFNCAENDDKSNARADLDIGNTVIEEMSLLNSDNLVKQNIDQILACPSILGKIVCLSMRLKEKSGPFYSSRYFKYGNQMKSVRKVEESISTDVKPFDFSTPSPDDIVLSKQRLAFTRSGNRQ